MFAISIGFRNGLSRLAVLPNLFKDDFIDVTPVSSFLFSKVPFLLIMLCQLPLVW